MNVEKADPKLRNDNGKGASNHLEMVFSLNTAAYCVCRLVSSRRPVPSPWPTASGTRTEQLQSTQTHLPTFDTGISVLVEDIYARGLDKDVTECRGRVRANAEDWHQTKLDVTTGHRFCRSVSLVEG
ncbi:MAG: hypothetical protein R3B91_19550 [Planctomycetaceae bacterium]